jgi:hypothetical protein
VTGPHRPALAGTAAWQAASHAQTLPYEDTEPGPGGQPAGVYTPVPIVHPPGWCRHLDTICADCLPAWQDELVVAVFDHGPCGAAHGCRCPVCQPPASPPSTRPPPDPNPAAVRPPAHPTTDTRAPES